MVQVPLKPGLSRVTSLAGVPQTRQKPGRICAVWKPYTPGSSGNEPHDLSNVALHASLKQRINELSLGGYNNYTLEFETDPLRKEGPSNKNAPLTEEELDSVILDRPFLPKVDEDDQAEDLGVVYEWHEEQWRRLGEKMKDEEESDS